LADAEIRDHEAQPPMGIVQKTDIVPPRLLIDAQTRKPVRAAEGEGSAWSMAFMRASK